MPGTGAAAPAISATTPAAADPAPGVPGEAPKAAPDAAEAAAIDDAVSAAAAAAIPCAGSPGAPRRNGSRGTEGDASRRRGGERDAGPLRRRSSCIFWPLLGKRGPDEPEDAEGLRGREALDLELELSLRFFSGGDMNCFIIAASRSKPSLSIGRATSGGAAAAAPGPPPARGPSCWAGRGSPVMRRFATSVARITGGMFGPSGLKINGLKPLC